MKLPLFLAINHFWRIIPFRRHDYTSSLSAVRYNSAQENVVLSLADTNNLLYGLEKLAIQYIMAIKITVPRYNGEDKAYVCKEEIGWVADTIA